ncbi:MAG: Double zinc ribbon [Methanomassiliicoccales archaeon PtaU1.Bin124]|nr:MAG: Double zinc ribbon [Methanomassiliicoccales archaeon PtaU1.Bin124]
MTARLPKRHEWPAHWLNGEVRKHCIRCEVEVERMERVCPRCFAPLRKECPRCHYWVELDASSCISCRYAFPLPVGEKATIRLWHPR